MVNRRPASVVSLEPCFGEEGKRKHITVFHRNDNNNLNSFLLLSLVELRKRQAEFPW